MEKNNSYYMDDEDDAFLLEALEAVESCIANHIQDLELVDLANGVVGTNRKLTTGMEIVNGGASTSKDTSYNYAGVPTEDIPLNIATDQHGEGRRKQQPKPLFEIFDQYSVLYRKFKTSGTYYNLKVEKPNPKMDPKDWLTLLISEVIEYFKKNSVISVYPKDKIGMRLLNSEQNTEPVYISLRNADQLDAEVILDHIMVIFDSNNEFFLNGFLAITFDHIQMPRGAGRICKPLGETDEEFLSKRAAFLKYKNPKNLYKDDEYCLPYAIVLGKLWRDYSAGIDKKKNKALIHSLQTSIYKLRNAAEELCARAGVDICSLRGGCTFEEVKKFQSILPNYQIVVYNGFDTKAYKPYTDKKYYSVDNKINIMLCNNHYTAMRSLTACFATDFICPDCHKRAHSSKKHTNCIYTCPCCLVRPPCQICTSDERIECPDCLRMFRGSDCFINHKNPFSKKHSVCERIKSCPICRIRYYVDKSNEHFCGIYYCTTCEKHEAYGHECHMPPYVTKRDGRNVLFVFFDFETQQNTTLSPSEPLKFKHVPHLCVLQTACDTCNANEDISVPCDSCGEREYIFHNGEQSVESLLNFLVGKANEREEVDEDEDNTEEDMGQIKKAKTGPYKFKKVIALAHNMSGFDGMFILSYIYGSKRFGTPKVIMNGTRVVKISLGYRLVFIDSLNYFHRALAELPDCFGFEGTKGWYPYLFSTPKTDNYKGELPAKHYYCPERLSVKERKKFEAWYNNHPVDYEFNNKEEIVEYCRQDVNILRKACLRFYNDFFELNQVDPYLDSCTLSGACSRAFRAKYLQENTIGIIPIGGYRFVDNQSKIAIKWLAMIEREEGIQLEHAGRGREKILPGIGRVDGYHEPTRRAFEFLGCWYHSHEKCQPIQYFGQRLNNITVEYNELPRPLDEFDERNQVMFMRRETTEEKNEAIRAAGYELVIMWECEFKKHLKANPEIDNMLKKLPIVIDEPLNVRDAFYGGRTDVNILYFKSDKVTKLLYFDVFSLYPFINKYRKAPVRAPKIHIGEDCLKVDWMKMDGLIKLTVLAPRGLHFPVLPCRMHKKLMFYLCNECAKTLNQSQCDHSEAERMFMGTWVLDEVKLAITHGYKVIKIHEIWEYEVVLYDPVTKSGGLFSGYIDAFVKIKTEATGFSESHVTDAEKDKYISDFYEREGVLLEREKMIPNKAKRKLAKDQLNGFWGRLALRPDLLRTAVIKSHDELIMKILDPKFEAHSIVHVNDETLLFNYKETEAARRPDNTVNVAIAAFTTCYGRMELYKYLDMLGPERVCYHDTDSVIFTAKEGDIMPETGEFLGMMTDELEEYGPNSYIDEFACAGPKNYAYKVYSPTTKETHTVVKVKGVTLNYETDQVINFDLIKKFVDAHVNKGEKNSVTVYNNAIRRTKTADVYSTRVKKTYTVNYTKRQKTGPNYGTVPYGF